MRSEGGVVALFVATKKGVWILRSDENRHTWRLEGPIFLGHIVNHAALDRRDRRTLLLAARTGHLGPTIFRSTDQGKSWKEATKPPAFPKVAGRGPVESQPQRPGRRQREPLPGGETWKAPPDARVVNHTFCLVPGHESEPDVWYAGTSPEGLFRSEDAGDTWVPVSGFNDSPWTGAPHPNDPDGVSNQPGTPDGDILHSIVIDPRDPDHMYIAMSANAGGVFESTDKGRTWRPLNAGCRADFLPDPFPEFGQDPHCLQLHPLAPDILWQQNHCGIYRLERPEERWERVGDNMPKDTGDIGFPIGLHPRDPDAAWVFPMDGTDVWPRISPAGRPAVYQTRDAGKSWRRCDRGLPPEQAWYTVLRQGMSVDAHDPVGVYFGATCGEVWASVDEGEEWRCLASHLPFVLAVEAMEFDE